MSDERDILDQADRLMRRNRVFVAGSRATVEPAEPVDDLPVLTDMVAPTEIGASAEPAPAPAISQEAIDERAQVLAHEFLLQRLAAQRQTIEKEVVAWLDKELPHIVMYVVDGLTDQLVAQITAAVRLELMPRLQLAVEAEQESQPSQDAT